MTKKVFISYSHKDESHKEALDEHLAMLKHNNIIDAWHDRKIIPGQDWSTEISENLSQAEIILFLISPSFLASDYCFNIEADSAIKLHEEGKAQLIPILLRPCDWTSSKFSKFQAIPKDAKAITCWGNSDEAWLDVINGIKRHLSSFKPTSPLVSLANKIVPSDRILHWIDDTEVVLTHRKADKVKLSDVYVSLDLELTLASKSKDISIKNSDIIFTEPDKYLIYGEEQQGKTSLLKYVYKNLLKLGIAPIYLNASEIKKSDIDKVLEPALGDQYNNLSFANYMKLPTKIILIDNLNDIGLNAKFRGALLSAINDNFDHVVVTCNPSFSYILPEITQLNEYKKVELLGLGHQKREEMVEKWVSLGVEESIDECDLYAQCDEIKARLDTVIRKNIVPAKPIYILMFLQMFEAYSQQNLELSSHGHCYQQLIYQAFDHAKIPKKETDKYLNVLTELSWAFYKNEGSINQYGLEQFFIEYEKTYLSVDGGNIISKLKANSILMETGSKIQFKYPYLYYFFAAKKIAESYSTNKNTQEEVANLISNLHREAYANILVFVTHHTKDAWVLEKIQTALNTLFSDQDPASLSNEQLVFMGDFLEKIPELVMEQREIRDERTKYNRNLDEIEKIQEPEANDANDLLANINKTFKGMEISGQIIRNRHATLTRTALFNLASEGALSGLRFLNFFINISDTAKLEVIKYIAIKLKEHPNLSNVEVQEYAKEVFLQMTYGVINGVIRKIASSIGSQEASEVYASIQRESPSPAIILLNQAIELQFKRNLDIQTISQTVQRFENNLVCRRILKEMVVQHTYMFPVGYKEKQQLAELLGISIQGQRLMDRKKQGKG